jgi:RimJ/RimL family protein N-acetyltransferase
MDAIGAYTEMMWIIGHWTVHGYGHWAVVTRDDGLHIGVAGLLSGMPWGLEDEVEIGWTLRRDCWGQGYAYEAASAVLEWGWTTLSVPRIISVMTPDNTRSARLAKRLGMDVHQTVRIRNTPFDLWVIDRPADQRRTHPDD